MAALPGGAAGLVVAAAKEVKVSLSVVAVVVDAMLEVDIVVEMGLLVDTEVRLDGLMVASSDVKSPLGVLVSGVADGTWSLLE